MLTSVTGTGVIVIVIVTLLKPSASGYEIILFYIDVMSCRSIIPITGPLS
jgi:anaerobic C4-dicarboxylate transporter